VADPATSALSGGYCGGDASPCRSSERTTAGVGARMYAYSECQLPDPSPWLVGTHGESPSVSVAYLSRTEAIERLDTADDGVAAELLDGVGAQRVEVRSEDGLQRCSAQVRVSG
jgi:hypothetical protein